jgi:membrane protease YdiL (CAAX protease family)
MHGAQPPRGPLTPAGALAVTLVLFAIAWFESAAPPWAPFYVVYVALTIALPLWCRTGRFGPLRAVPIRHWVLAIVCGIAAQVVISAVALALLPRMLAALAGGAEAVATPFWNLGAAQVAMSEKLAPRWNTTPAQLQMTYLLFLVAWSGFGEEVYFRGYLHAAFGTRWNIGAVAVVSALLFGVRHAMQLSALGASYPWGAAAVWSAYGFLFGLLLSWLYVRTGSLWPPILAHYVFNLVPVALGAAG